MSREEAVPEAVVPLDAVSEAFGCDGWSPWCDNCLCACRKQYELQLALVGSTELVDVESEWLHLNESGTKALKGRLMVEAKQRGKS